jgi:carboxylesterase
MTELMHPLAASFRLHGEKADAFLMLHGWTGSPAHFRLAAQFVNDHGYSAAVPRLAGHGTSVHHMADTGWRDWVRSALEALEDIHNDYERVHVVGLSMGAIIALLLGATCDVASVTTINAPQRLHDRRARLTRLYRGTRKIQPGERSEPPSETAEFWVQYEDSPVGTVPDLLDLMDAARQALPRIQVPVVIIQSKADETVRHQSAEIIYEGLASPSKRIVWLERSGHVALLDSERHRIHQEILAQVATSTSASASS